MLAALCTTTVVIHTLWHIWWSEGCWCWTTPTVTCTGGLFLPPRAVAHVLNACMPTCAVVVVVVVAKVVVAIVVMGHNIVTCTVGWWWWCFS